MTVTVEIQSILKYGYRILSNGAQDAFQRFLVRYNDKCAN